LKQNLYDLKATKFCNMWSSKKPGPTFKDFTRDYSLRLNESFSIVNETVTSEVDDWVVVVEPVEESVLVEPNGTILERAAC